MAIDSYAPSNSEEHLAALTPEGQAFVGDRDLRPRPMDIVWQEVSDNRGYPENACDITIDEQGNRARVKVITTEGEVWELVCRTNGRPVVCDGEWNELAMPSVMASTADARSGGMPKS